jgi:hypothetical protein
MNLKTVPYSNTLSDFRKRIRAKFPRARLMFPNLTAINRNKITEDLWVQERMCEYILYMIDALEIESDIAARGRRIGWIGAHLEIMGIITNPELNDLIRKDQNNY